VKRRKIFPMATAKVILCEEMSASLFSCGGVIFSPRHVTN
jgi:hypothetical protein